VKADAYGHGSIAISRHLHQAHQVDLFAVATLEEATELNKAIPGISILIFSRIFPDELPDLSENMILTIVSLEHARSIGKALSRKIDVHLNVNTGMNRLGLSPDEALTCLEEKHSQLNIKGIYSHFSSSDSDSEQRYEEQRKIFSKFVIQARARGFKGVVHLSNSASLINTNHDCYDAMRLGIGLYGYNSYGSSMYQNSIQPVMTVKAPLVRRERIAAGESVSYGERWTATRATNIGTLRIGYADGYTRSLTNQAWVTHKEKDYAVVGTVTMDHIMIDLGEDFPEPGAMFTVLGGESKQVAISNVADRLNTIPYELCCAITQRVTRIYLP
jgi:alanine racemase